MQHELDTHLLKLLRRRRWLRRLLRPLPRRANVRRYPVIKWFAEHAGRYPFLWSFKRQHVLPALYAGSVLALLPLYGVQLPIAFLIAVLLRANLTLTVALQFLTNPFTLVPIYGATAWVGSKLMTAFGVGADLPTPLFYANALFVGGAAVGLATALAADLGWRFGAWEAAQFRAKLAALRQAAAARHAGEGDASP